jgi:hypothetical protein
VQVVGEARHLLDDRLVAPHQPVIGHDRGHRHGEAEGGHDQSLADRAGDRVDRRLTGGADLDQGAIDADHRSEQTDEGSGRTDGGEKRKAGAETGSDRPLTPGQRVRHPVVLVDRIGQLVMLLERHDAVVDDLAIGAVLLELAGAFPKVGRLPEARPGALRLVDDLLLLEQFHEQYVPGRGRHQHQDAERHLSDQSALLECGDQAVRVLARRMRGFGRCALRHCDGGPDDQGRRNQQVAGAKAVGERDPHGSNFPLI